MKKRLAELEAKNWTFLFLGAGLDALGEAQTVGIGAASSASYSNHIPSSVGNTYAVTSAKLTRSRGMSASGGSMMAMSSAMTFTMAEQAAIKSGDDASDLIAAIKNEPIFGGGGAGVFQQQQISPADHLLAFLGVGFVILPFLLGYFEARQTHEEESRRYWLRQIWRRGDIEERIRERSN